MAVILSGNTYYVMDTEINAVCVYVCVLTDIKSLSCEQNIKAISLRSFIHS